MGLHATTAETKRSVPPHAFGIKMQLCNNGWFKVQSSRRRLQMESPGRLFSILEKQAAFTQMDIFY